MQSGERYPKEEIGSDSSDNVLTLSYFYSLIHVHTLHDW